MHHSFVVLLVVAVSGALCAVSTPLNVSCDLIHALERQFETMFSDEEIAVIHEFSANYDQDNPQKWIYKIAKKVLEALKMRSPSLRKKIEQFEEYYQSALQDMASNPYYFLAALITIFGWWNDQNRYPETKADLEYYFPIAAAFFRRDETQKIVKTMLEIVPSSVDDRCRWYDYGGLIDPKDFIQCELTKSIPSAGKEFFHQLQNYEKETLMKIVTTHAALDRYKEKSSALFEKVQEFLGGLSDDDKATFTNIVDNFAALKRQKIESSVIFERVDNYRHSLKDNLEALGSEAITFAEKVIEVFRDNQAAFHNNDQPTVDAATIALCDKYHTLSEDAKSELKQHFNVAASI